MNSNSYPTQSSSSVVPRDAEPRDAELRDAGHDGLSSVGVSETGARRGSRTWLVSLTVICFLFGGLLAMQLRAIETVRAGREGNAKGQAEAQARMEKMQRLAAAERDKNAALAASLAQAKSALASGSKMSTAQAKQLGARIKELQMMAGLTAVSGPGVVVRLTDNPNAANGDAGPFLPGIVHDFDVLQVVNELRSAKAEAIAVNGTRITGYTPIRCVGPIIYVNWEVVAEPFRIEAIGDPANLMSALKTPNGIVDNLKNQTLGVQVTTARQLHLPATESIPQLKLAKAQ
ncbi:MAG TPA: DUF881 domain-containing protein [Abditibacteriaceae bacterium]|nr:DUF881 domain-containing protein [Abditibacteriaceae bacterium]